MVSVSGRNHARTIDEWTAVLGSLLVGEAAVPPITDESGGELRRIRLVPRLTAARPSPCEVPRHPGAAEPCVRILERRCADGTRAGTLREYVHVVETSAKPVLAGHPIRGDFSRWVAEVFGDYPLAIDLRRLETRYRAGTLGEPGAAFGQAIRSRYEFLDPAPASLPDPHETRNGPAHALRGG